MKKLFFLILLVCFVQIANAQLLYELPIPYLKDLGLKGRIKEVIELDYGGEINGVTVDTLGKYNKTVLKFDVDGKRKETTEYDPDGNMIVKWLFDYTKERTVEVNRTNNANILLSRYIFKYNDQGKQIECDSYVNYIIDNVVDTVFSKYIFKYDVNGNRIEEDIQDEKSAYIDKIIFLYNDKHQQIEKDSYSVDGSLYAKTLYEYDQSGNTIKNEDYDPNKGISIGGDSAAYSNIDKHGNWLLKNYQESFSPNKTGGMVQKGIIKRTILYY